MGSCHPVKVTITNELRVTNTSAPIVQEIRRQLTFDNPRWIENDKMGRWQGETPQVLRFYRRQAGGLMIPRGYLLKLYYLCQRRDESFAYTDHRRVLPDAGMTFKGSLRPFQQQAVRDMLRHDFGTLVCPTGGGKTVMGLYMAAERRQPTLVVVHTKELLHQWTERICSFLDIAAADIGVIGQGRKHIGRQITVALIQSLYKCAADVKAHVGHLIIDECHRTPSRTFTEAVKRFDCKYMTGLSATPWRRDKLSRLIFIFIGDVQHRVENTALIRNGDILSADVIVRETDFVPWSDPSTEYSTMLSELADNADRNRLICGDVAAAAGQGQGVCLVLTDRKSHCETLQRTLARDFGTEASVMTGDTPAAVRRDTVQRINTGDIRVLIATGQLMGEGFDCRALTTLFLVTPVKFSGRVIQYLGRVLRPAPGKEKAVVYDYVDVNVGPLKAAAKARQRIYQGVQE